MLGYKYRGCVLKGNECKSLRRLLEFNVDAYLLFMLYCVIVIKIIMTSALYSVNDKS